MDNPINQNYTVKYDDNKETVKIFGNLFNAYNILKEHSLISTNFTHTILDDVDVIRFLGRTKNFILPENMILDDESTSSNEMEGSTIEKRYINIYRS